MKVRSFIPVIAALFLGCSGGKFAGTGKHDGKKKNPDPPADPKSDDEVEQAPTIEPKSVEHTICTKNNFFSPTSPLTGVERDFELIFEAAECSNGVLPSDKYIGFFSAQEICGSDKNWVLIQPTADAGPKVTVTWTGACPGPASASFVQAVFINKDAGSTDATKTTYTADEILENVVKNSESILCHITDYASPTTAASTSVRLNFTAEQCGGKLPDDSFYGMLSKMDACGKNESWIVHQARSDATPQVSFWYLGGCTQANAPSNIKALFIKRSTVIK